MDITKEWLEQHLNERGLSVLDVARAAGCSYANIYRLLKKFDLQRTHRIKKQCEQCSKIYLASTRHGTHLRQRWCSKVCRESAWKEEHPERIRELGKLAAERSKAKNPILCRACQKPIPPDYRKSGLVHCSQECARASSLLKGRRYRNKAQEKFDSFKLSNGCCLCGYKKCSRSLDLHHIDPEQKDLRITATQFVTKTELIHRELAKCILVCKNCHYELHDLMMRDLQQYDEKTKNLSRCHELS